MINLNNEFVEKGQFSSSPIAACKLILTISVNKFNKDLQSIWRTLFDENENTFSSKIVKIPTTKKENVERKMFSSN